AAEHGAIACLIYSDPHEDGYFQGEVYPDGPFRGWGMIQRGSVMDMPRYPGDPSTPDRPSKPGVERIPMDKIETFAPIPVQPLSYRDGVELLKRLKGPIAPEAWRGALPITYHIGPGPAAIHMKLQMEYAQRRLIDVVARIPGGVAPDEWIIVGSHRDAWTFGASDSVSGHVSMMAVARAMGDMIKKGWRPRRSIVFVSWDGEEQGLLGSTEWVRQRRPFADAVRARARAGDPAGGREEDALRRLAAARARAGAERRSAAAAADAAGWRARIGVGLHGVPRSHRRRLARHGIERYRRRGQLPFDLRQPDLVQEVHRSAIQVLGARDGAHRRGAAAACRRRAAAVRL
ncbi:MAG: M28 family peptidase, partial [Gemmatimonadetes bacterium]|nr:M28 family peptidase [Gemmatimonadota bacterium]